MDMGFPQDLAAKVWRKLADRPSLYPFFQLVAQVNGVWISS